MKPWNKKIKGSYIYLHKDWPAFTWNNDELLQPLVGVRSKQHLLKGYMETLGFTERNVSTLDTLTQDVLKTSEIEGELLKPDQVRSSIARKLGIDVAGLVNTGRDVDGVVEMMLDATQHYKSKLTKERLFGWHAALFPAGRSGMQKIITGKWRNDSTGPMQVVSGPMGRETVHYQAPPAKELTRQMTIFLQWFNAKQAIDPVIKAAVAHLWFVTLHPFDDGNGRIARAIADMQLTRADDDARRFYSMSARIRVERKQYYDILERTQKGNMDITPWLLWFLACLDGALQDTEGTVKRILKKARFWDKYAHKPINERQRMMLNKLFDGFYGNLTSSKWAAMVKCSADTAVNDINELIKMGILKKGEAGGRSTNYLLKEV
jgi:Fic family protein